MPLYVIIVKHPNLQSSWKRTISNYLSGVLSIDSCEKKKDSHNYSQVINRIDKNKWRKVYLRWVESLETVV